MDANRLSEEVDTNFDFFQRTLTAYLQEHSGEYALLRHRAVVGFYRSPGDADRAGKVQFPDGLYSIQEVADEPVNLGLYSNAGN
jgi:hypothetical protein